MARVFERLILVCTLLYGMVYGERLIRAVLLTISRLDAAHLHGVEITGSALGFTQAGIAAAVVLFAVVPAILSVFDAFDGRKMPATLVVGELVAALLLFGASGRVLHESVHARIVGTGDTRVLAVRASVTTEAVE
ncbi:MAG TPA: hypothetical protein VK679_19940 [Gemmatimonadaceae bacterium]|nr:hypothetical protein [Gemmatimonadaceae bacterium]